MVLALLAGLAACSPNAGDNDKTLRIVAGSEQKLVLEEIVLPWCQSNGYECPYTLKGSVDQARLLQTGSTEYDAYWFASSVFAQIGNSDGVLRELQPMFLTPTVFAGWKSKMTELGFVGRDDVSVADIIAVTESDQVNVWATNPTQSNSGATTLFAFLNYFAGNGPGEPLTQEQLDSPEVEQGITTFARGFERTPPSTGTMMEECLADKANCDAVFTYEDLVIENNLELTARGEEPLYLVYPEGALAISDAPLGFLPVGQHADAKQQIFTELQNYLLHDDGARTRLADMGRRPGDSIGLVLDNPNLEVFNPDWGVRTDIREQGITFPAAAVINETLDRYQTRYRNPVNIYYCLDGSGSMEGKGWEGVEDASDAIFDPEQARLNRLQTGPEDVTTVQIFNSATAAGPWTVNGNEPSQLSRLNDDVKGYSPSGGTDMYNCLSDALNTQGSSSLKNLIVVMSDGMSDGEGKAGGLIADLQAAEIPVIAIAFGDADPRQMSALAEGTGGSYDSSDDLVSALRKAAGYR